MNTFTLGLIVIAYLLSLAYLGFLGYKKTTSASDYLVGGRQMNPFVMALSYGATFISASAIVGFGGVAAAFGMGIQWLCFLNMFIGVVIAFIFFGVFIPIFKTKPGSKKHTYYRKQIWQNDKRVAYSKHSCIRFRLILVQM